MAVIRNQKRILNNSRLILTNTVFENANDYVDVEVNNATSLLEKDKYTRRHIPLSGSFKASFPETTESDESGGEGYIFPSRNTYALNQSKFRVTALEDNSVYYCVIPMDFDSILDIEPINLSVDQVLTFSQNSVYFIFCDEYYLNGEQKTGRDVIACENSHAFFLSKSVGKIIKFTAINGRKP